MDDETIIELFCRRDESAVAELECKYGAYCMSIAMNLLQNGEDAEECVNDALFRTWQQIPPQHPKNLRTWLGRIVRDASITLWHKRHAQKRYAGETASLEGLSELLPAFDSVEQELESREISALLNRWLSGLPAQDSKLFVRRYWYGVNLGELAKEMDISPQRLSQKMFRLRTALKRFLQQEADKNA